MAWRCSNECCSRPIEKRPCARRCVALFPQLSSSFESAVSGCCFCEVTRGKALLFFFLPARTAFGSFPPIFWVEPHGEIPRSRSFVFLPCCHLHPHFFPVEGNLNPFAFQNTRTVSCLIRSCISFPFFFFPFFKRKAGEQHIAREKSFSPALPPFRPPPRVFISSAFNFLVFFLCLAFALFSPCPASPQTVQLRSAAA